MHFTALILCNLYLCSSSAVRSYTLNFIQLGHTHTHTNKRKKKYGQNFIYINKQSVAFTTLIFTKPVTTQWNNVGICTEFQENLSQSVESTRRSLFTPLNEVLPLVTKFSWNTLWHPSVKNAYTEILTNLTGSVTSDIRSQTDGSDLHS
jgi:hypothetical protein